MVSNRVVGVRSGCRCEICGCGWVLPVPPPILVVVVVVVVFFFFFFFVGADISCSVCLGKEILELGCGFV